MANPEEQLLLDAGTHIQCGCMNVIPVESVNCPACRRFNVHTSANECPTCGQELKKKPES